MALSITQEVETKNINKTAELKNVDGVIIGTASFNVTNQQYNGISVNINISNKELFVADIQTFRTDITNFLELFTEETKNVMEIVKGEKE